MACGGLGVTLYILGIHKIIYDLNRWVDIRQFLCIIMHEANLSAKSEKEKKDPRVPGTNEDKEWQKGAQQKKKKGS